MPLSSLFDWRGRIGRGQWWLRVVVVAAVLIGLLVTFGFASLWLGRSVPQWGDVTFSVTFVIGALVWLVATAVVIIAGIARLHDRGKSGWWLLLFYGVPTWLNGVSGDTWNGAPATLFDAGLAAVGFAISLWGFVELGFLRGTDGPNRFGPKP